MAGELATFAQPAAYLSAAGALSTRNGGLPAFADDLNTFLAVKTEPFWAKPVTE